MKTWGRSPLPIGSLEYTNGPYDCMNTCAFVKMSLCRVGWEEVYLVRPYI
jgi:hypothetical protein